jgi:mevalonate pyrophosphate decarboxylase
MDVPTVYKVSNSNDSTTYAINYPIKSKVRYVLVYAAKNSAKMNVNDPSQIIDKIAFNEKNGKISIVIKNNNSEKNTNYALSFIDFYGNESEATLLQTTAETKTPQSFLNNGNRQ